MLLLADWLCCQFMKRTFLCHKSSMHLKSIIWASSSKRAIESHRRIFLFCQVTVAMEDLKTPEPVRVWSVFCAQQEQSICFDFPEKRCSLHVPEQAWELSQHMVGGTDGGFAPKPCCCSNAYVHRGGVCLPDLYLKYCRTVLLISVLSVPDKLLQ